MITGKPAYADMYRREKSLPVTAALATGTMAASELAALYRRQPPPSGTGLVHAADLARRADGRSWSQAQAADLLACALDRLDAAGLTAHPGAELSALAWLVTHRDH